MGSQGKTRALSGRHLQLGALGAWGSAWSAAALERTGEFGCGAGVGADWERQTQQGCCSPTTQERRHATATGSSMSRAEVRRAANVQLPWLAHAS